MIMENKIDISVVMSVFNSEKYIEQTIKSILVQTYKNFELIIIDDCSYDKTLSVINQFNDKRIKLIMNSQNRGLPANLNTAVEMAKGDFIARIDSDDIMHPRRLERQLQFLKKHSDIMVIGSNAKGFGDKTIKLLTPKKHEKIKATLVFDNTIIHPTIFIRKSILIENKYNDQFINSQDYELWTRLIMKYRFHNIQKSLLLYRFHSNQTKRDKQIYYNNMIRSNYLITLFPSITREEILQINELVNHKSIEIEVLIKYIDTVRRLLQYNREFKSLNHMYFKRAIKDSLGNYSIQLITNEKHILRKLKLIVNLNSTYFKKDILKAVIKRIKNRMNNLNEN